MTLVLPNAYDEEKFKIFVRFCKRGSEVKNLCCDWSIKNERKAPVWAPFLQYSVAATRLV